MIIRRKTITLQIAGAASCLSLLRFDQYLKSVALLLITISAKTYIFICIYVWCVTHDAP